MRNYIYKVIIATIALIIVFEFTVGRKFNEFNEVTAKLLTKEGRKGMIASIKTEMEKLQKRRPELINTNSLQFKLNTKQNLAYCHILNGKNVFIISDSFVIT